ncbi:MAG: hypothetical protein M3Y59_14685 [Myxococcota bacterium]|nr:hypothetical protein [Myxococcota bacterium]
MLPTPPSEAGADSRWSAALRATPPRSVQVIIHCLLQRQPVPACAAFYGISEDAFFSLLGRSLAELARQQGLTAAETAAHAPDAPQRLRRALDLLATAGPQVPDDDLERLVASLKVPPERDYDLERLVASLWRAGPRALPPPAPLGDPESWWSTALRLALIGAAIVALLWFSKVL